MHQQPRAHGSFAGQRTDLRNAEDQLSPELREVLHMLDEFEHHPDHTMRK